MRLIKSRNGTAEDLSKLIVEAPLKQGCHDGEYLDRWEESRYDESIWKRMVKMLRDSYESSTCVLLEFRH